LEVVLTIVATLLEIVAALSCAFLKMIAPLT